MANTDYTKFQAVTRNTSPLLLETLEVNLKRYFDWCLLNIGFWTDVNISDGVFTGGNFYTLNPVDDTYTIYETPRKNLVYEEFEYDGNSPIEIAGVRVNGTLYTSGHGTYGHNIDYINGRVIFNSARSSTDIITMSYSYKDISVERAIESDIWKEIQYGSFKPSDTHLTDNEKGQWTAIPALRRQQLPALIIESVPRRISTGWQLGSKSRNIFQDVLFHVVAENSTQRNQLTDIIDSEKFHTIFLMNIEDIHTDDWPINYLGYKNSLGLMYPDLIEEYKWIKITFSDMKVSEVANINPYLFQSTIRSTIECVFTSD